MEPESSPSCINTGSVSKCLEIFWYKLIRTKPLDVASWSTTKLAKCLSVVDLTFLGIGGTLGAGVYVVTGQVAKSMAGPAVFISFLIAGIASIFAGLCYAEFGARVPRAGSAYVYSYVTVGEFCAFIIGWNVVLEYAIGVASVARGFSAYVDLSTGKVMSAYLTEHVPLSTPTLSIYPDFLAFGLVILVSVVVCLGMSESSLINSIFTIINLSVISYVVICGLFKLNVNNWTIPANKVPNPDVNGVGGFLPFGIEGVFSGAATCFYAFVGFDVIAAAGEETLNPEKAIPFAIISCLAICSIAYMLPAIVLTLMVPYFDLVGDASLPRAFGHVGWYVAEYIISAGAIISLVCCSMTTLCGLSRVVYAMASDGLIYRVLARVSTRFKTPVIATMTAGFLTALLALLLEFKDLVAMLSIGTLLAYSLVAICVQLLRYECDSSQLLLNADVTEALAMEKQTSLHKIIDVIKPASRIPTKRTNFVVKCSMLVYAISCLWAGLILRYLWRELFAAVWWVVLLLVIPLAVMLLSLVLTCLQPQQNTKLNFKVPFVPFIPSLSFFINLFLMLNLSSLTWLRFCIWMIMGFIIYFTYGIHHNGNGSQQNSPEHYLELDGSNLETESQNKSPSSLTLDQQQDKSALPSYELDSTKDHISSPVPPSSSTPLYSAGNRSPAARYLATVGLGLGSSEK